MIADPSTYLLPLVTEMAKQWPANRVINLVFHGHSVPAGYFATPYVNTLEAYPQQVLVGIKERFPFAVVNVIVTAIGGENSEEGARRFETDVLCHRPNLILIDYALNDRGIGLERAGAAWIKMINLAQNRDIPLILLTPTLDQLAIRTGDPSYSFNLADHANQVQNLASERSLGLANCFAAFNAYIAGGGRGHLYDLLSHVNHPNRFGHSLVAREILRYFPAQ
jgi:acyl-CoA thioesterase I